jgi:hypothetical protein
MLNVEMNEKIKSKIESSTFDEEFKKNLSLYFKTVENQDHLNFAIEAIKK